MKTHELENIALQVKYVSPLSVWNDNDYINACFNVMLRNDILHKGIHIILKMFSPSIIIYKSLLKSYIKEMTKQQHEVRTSS